MAAGGAGGRSCNPLGAGPWLCTSGSIPGAWCRTRISSRSGRVRTLLGFALTGEGKRGNPERFPSPRCATVTPSFPRSPPAAGPGGAGRSTCGRTLAARPAGRPRLQLGLSAAPWLPAPSRRRAAPGHLRSSAAQALPAGSMELPDLRVRPQRRPENGRRLLGPSAPFHPGAGRRAARPRADAQASGRLWVAGLQPPGATALKQAGTGLRGHRAGPGHRAQASRTQVLCSVSRTKFSGTRCHLCFPMTVRGGLDYFPTWYESCLTQKSGPSSSNKGHCLPAGILPPPTQCGALTASCTPRCRCLFCFESSSVESSICFFRKDPGLHRKILKKAIFVEYSTVLSLCIPVPHQALGTWSFW